MSIIDKEFALALTDSRTGKANIVFLDENLMTDGSEEIETERDAFENLDDLAHNEMAVIDIKELEDFSVRDGIGSTEGEMRLVFYVHGVVDGMDVEGDSPDLFSTMESNPKEFHEFVLESFQELEIYEVFDLDRDGKVEYNEDI